MKTMNSKFRKAGMETIATMAAIFATCFTLNAQGDSFESRMDGRNEYAMSSSANVELSVSGKSKVASDLAYFAECLKVEEEKDLKVEKWMTDAEIFHATELENENQLEVADWMINEMLFNATSEETAIEEPETVVKPVVRAKAVGITFPGAQFGRRAFILVELEDPELELENWMVDNNFWKAGKKK